MISVHQEDCSTHEVHRRQNYDRCSLFGCVEQPEDWNWRIEDDGRSVLTSVRSTAEPCRVDTCKPRPPLSTTFRGPWLTLPNCESAALMSAPAALWRHSNAMNAFSRGSTSVADMSSFSFRSLILDVMLRTSTWLCTPTPHPAHSIYVYQTLRTWMDDLTQLMFDYCIFWFYLHCIASLYCFIITCISLLQYLAIQPSRLQGCSNKISCQLSLSLTAT